MNEESGLPELTVLHTSKNVVAAASKHMMRMIRSVHESVYEKEDVMTLLIPDFHVDTVKALIDLLLTGIVNCPTLEDLAKLQKLTRYVFCHQHSLHFRINHLYCAAQTMMALLCIQYM